MHCTSCGVQALADSAFCTGCGKPVNSTSSAQAYPSGSSIGATAGPISTYGAAIPEGVKGWSWGAFLLNWIWAIGNRTWIGLLALIPYVGFLVAIWLGFKGREMAWKNQQWRDLEHFNQVQKKWSKWAVGITLGVFLLGIVAAIAIPAYQDYKQKAYENELGAASLETLIAPAEQATSVAEIADAGAPAATAETGEIDSNADGLPTTLHTVAGVLERKRNSDDESYIALQGQALFEGLDAQWQFPVRAFKLSSGEEAILMASSGGRGNSCETLFYFLIAGANGMKPTPLFGTCAAQGRFTKQGDAITVTLPKMGGHDTFTLESGRVYENGSVVALNESTHPFQ